MTNRESRDHNTSLRELLERAKLGVSAKPDALTRQEMDRYSSREAGLPDDPSMPARLLNELHIAAINDYLGARKQYIPKLFWLTCTWVFCLLLLVLLSGTSPPYPTNRYMPFGFFGTIMYLINWIFSFKLSDAVLMTLVGSTTANVLGLFYVVARFLYPAGRSPDHFGELFAIEEARPVGRA